MDNFADIKNEGVVYLENSEDHDSTWYWNPSKRACAFKSKHLSFIF